MMCSEASPQVSFSHDSAGQAEGELLDMNSDDFEFNITTSSSEQEPCSADELFANGFILPVQFQNTSKQVQKCAAPPTVSLLPPLPPPPPRPRPHENSKQQKYLQIIEVNNGKKDLEERPSSESNKSLWGFKRSSSLNCYVKKSLIRSIFLTRSNSTSSSLPSPPPLKENKQHHHRSQKLQGSSPPPSTSSSSNPYQSRKNKKNYQGNGVKVSPLLNLPPPYISKGTANLFGFGSLLRSSSISVGSKDKKNKK